MKLTYIAFVLGVVATLIGLGASFASAPKYGVLFAIIIACDFLAAGCFAYLFRLSGGWKIAVLLPSVIVVYTVADVIARAFFSARVLDLLR